MRIIKCVWCVYGCRKKFSGIGVTGIQKYTQFDEVDEFLTRLYHNKLAQIPKDTIKDYKKVNFLLIN